QEGAQTHAYDTSGNPSGSTIQVGPNNELLSDGTWNYSYDANGNETGKVSIADGTTWLYAYNGANEQVSAIEKDASGTTLVQVTSTFDVFGNHIAQTVQTFGTGI